MELKKVRKIGSRYIPVATIGCVIGWIAIGMMLYGGLTETKAVLDWAALPFIVGAILVWIPVILTGWGLGNEDAVNARPYLIPYFATVGLSFLALAVVCCFSAGWAALTGFPCWWGKRK